MADEETTADRLRKNLNDPYPVDPDAEWHGLMEALGQEFDDLDEMRQEILDGKYVDTATDHQLDKIGTFVFTPRRTNEGDDHYRVRLKVQLQKHLGGATLDDIQSTSAVLLQTDPSEIEIQDTYNTEPASFEITVGSSAIEDANITTADFAELIDDIRGAGIKATAVERGTFTHRSLEDFNSGINDPEKGYGNGTYASLIN